LITGLVTRQGSIPLHSSRGLATAPTRYSVVAT